MKLAAVLLMLALPLAGCLGGQQQTTNEAADEIADDAALAPKINGYYARIGLELMTRGVGGAWYRSAGTALPGGPDVAGWIVEVHWEPGSAYWDQIRLTIGTGTDATPAPGDETPAPGDVTGGSPLRIALPVEAAGDGPLEWRIAEVPNADGPPLYQDFHVVVATFNGVPFDADLAVPTEPVDPDH